MLDVCKFLGVKKLNTTAYHPQCDGTIERFNRTLKNMLRKHVDRFGTQWDRFLPGVMWSYRNTPHSSTGERPSFLLFGVDCRSPTEAAFLPVPKHVPVDIPDYRQELLLSLSSARELAQDSIRRAQKRYKLHYDEKATVPDLKVGEWVLVRFPQEETGRNRKLSRPWHGPYRITERRDPNVSATKVYFPEENAIKVHLARVCRCPRELPAGYYWYGGKRKGPGRPPKWVDKLLSGAEKVAPNDSSEKLGTDLPGAEPQLPPVDLALEKSHGHPSDDSGTSSAVRPASKDSHLGDRSSSLEPDCYPIKLPRKGVQIEESDEECCPTDASTTPRDVATSRKTQELKETSKMQWKTRSRRDIRAPDRYM